MKIKRLTHLSYSPELHPCDLWLFGRGKTALRDRTFADADTVVEALTNLLDEVTFGELQSIFQNWI
jgi:hypothetical protein